MAKTIKIVKFPSKNPFSRHLDPMRRAGRHDVRQHLRAGEVHVLARAAHRGQPHELRGRLRDLKYFENVKILMNFKTFAERFKIFLQNQIFCSRHFVFWRNRKMRV